MVNSLNFLYLQTESNITCVLVLMTLGAVSSANTVCLCVSGGGDETRQALNVKPTYMLHHHNCYFENFM